MMSIQNPFVKIEKLNTERKDNDYHVAQPTSKRSMSPKMVDMELTIDDVARSVSLELTTTDEKSSWYPK
jgi:hypothetical protein